MREKLLALAPSPIVLAHSRPAALPAIGSLTLAHVHARPVALLALAPCPLVLLDARPSARLALAPWPILLADARLAAHIAQAPLPVVLTLPRLASPRSSPPRRPIPRLALLDHCCPLPFQHAPCPCHRSQRQDGLRAGVFARDLLALAASTTFPSFTSLRSRPVALRSRLASRLTTLSGQKGKAQST